MKTGEKTNFIHDDWLSKEKGYSKDLPAKIKGKEALDSKYNRHKNKLRVICITYYTKCHNKA